MIDTEALDRSCMIYYADDHPILVDIDTHFNNCRNCGAPLNKFKCDYCGSYNCKNERKILFRNGEIKND